MSEHGDSGGLGIEALTAADLHAATGFDASFIVHQRVRLSMREDGGLAYISEPLRPPYRKHYRDDADAQALREYLGDGADFAAYVARKDGQVIGRLLLSRTWNGYAGIDDIAVAASARRSGAGSALLRQALAWARERGLPGVMLETQDTNVGACALYQRNGFVLGGFDRFHYANEPDLAHETALFWYYRF